MSRVEFLLCFMLMIQYFLVMATVVGFATILNRIDAAASKLGTPNDDMGSRLEAEM